MKKKFLNVFLLMLFAVSVVRADEGMWLLSLLNGATIQDMQAKGCKLTAEDIYSVNKACLKDAVVIFGGGCTGEMISANGLVLTNHHCGYGAVQSHSSVEHDYLTDGFWAMSKEEELPNEHLSVRFLRYMKDVTGEVLSGTENAADAKAEDSVIAANIRRIIRDAVRDTHYEATVESMYYGNQYFLFVYERYKDVRLVGAPPSSIGNFGRDNDNWMWPRHTGDFSIFRVYADKNNQPAEYSPDNVPYTPRKFLEISLDGVEKGDFTMILGYPGSTEQFLYSGALRNMVERSLPLKIDLRTRRLEIMDKYMKGSDKVRIQYASKYRGVSNSWKKWQGIILGLDRLDAVNKKVAFEKSFQVWAEKTPERRTAYGSVLDQMDDVYQQLVEMGVMMDLLREDISAVEIFSLSSRVIGLMKDSADIETINSAIESFNTDYSAGIDREIFAVMMEQYVLHADPAYLPEMLREIPDK